MLKGIEVVPTETEKCVTCMLCAQKPAHGGGTMNLKNHLQTNHHRKEYEELYETDDNQPTLDNFVQASGVKRLPQNSA